MTSPLPTMIGLGRLVDFIIRDTHGRRLRVTPTGERWLAWKADTRELVVLQTGRGGKSSPHRSDAWRHRDFHGADPQSSRQMKWPASNCHRRVLGLIESVTYTAEGIRSPSKGLHHWIHQFGDRGERGHGVASSRQGKQFDDRLFPRLDSDSAGNLFVVRRNGNRYQVQEWIIG